MKPWRPYWKQFERVLDELVKGVAPTPFGEFINACQWISKLPFDEVSHCDFILRHWIEDLDNKPDSLPFLMFDTPSLRWQLILRLECGLTFCRGDVGNRKEYNWDQNPALVYRWLLIDYWHLEAIYWAKRTYGSSDSRRSKIESDLRSALWKLARPKRIEDN